jgi:hypothetical protein
MNERDETEDEPDDWLGSGDEDDEDEPEPPSPESENSKDSSEDGNSAPGPEPDETLGDEPTRSDTETQGDFSGTETRGEKNQGESPEDTASPTDETTETETDTDHPGEYETRTDEDPISGYGLDTQERTVREPTDSLENRRRLEELETELRRKEAKIERTRDELEDREEELARRERDIEVNNLESKDETTSTDRPAKAAGFLLGFAGIVGLFSGIVVAAATAAPGVRLAVPIPVPLTDSALIASGVAVSFLSIFVLGGGWWSYHTKRWYAAVSAALLSSLVLSPLGLTAVILLAVSESRFD